MLLSNLIAPIKGVRINCPDCDISGITADSRNVKPGFLFVAIPGTRQDGRDFLNDAIAKGAVAVLLPEGSPAPSSVGVLYASDMRMALSSLAASFYPRQPQTIAAVTGTSGKTSTAQFTRELWSHAGRESASLGTLGLITSKSSKYGSLTTPDPITLHQILDETVGNNITHLAMEASSHGLALRRLDHVRIQIAGFSNLSRDHLDYHESMEEYFAAKLRLFNDLLQNGGTAVLNADVPEFDELKRNCNIRGHKIISYGKNGKEIKIQNYQPHPKGQVVRFALMGKNYEILLPVIGEFQVWNSLCALGLVLGSGENAEKSVASLEKLTGVPGRLQLIGETSKGAAVFVDYAHKPGALENVLAALLPHVNAHAGARLHVVFGCGGNRDKGKRPLMREIAQRLADNVIVTDDNPRNESPEIIRKEILAGCATGENLREIGDRATAIKSAIGILQANDVLVIAGKGHENGQIIGDQVLPFDDAEVARQALQGEKK